MSRVDGKAPDGAGDLLGVPGVPGLLKRAGVRITHPRLLVLGLLAESGGQALAANDLYRLMQARHYPTSLSTIYSVLQMLKLHRLVTVRYLDDGVQGFTCPRDDGDVSPARDAPAPAVVRAAAPAVAGPARP